MRTPRSMVKFVSGCMILAGSLLGGVFGTPSKDMPHGDQETAGFGIILLVIGIIMNVCSFKLDKKRKENLLELEKEKEATELKRKEQEKKKQIELIIYNKCLENNILNFDSKKNKDALLIIASSYGIEDIDEAQKMFYNAKERVEKENKERELKAAEERINRCRKNDQKIYDDAVKIINYKGKEKYLYSLKHDLERGRKALELGAKAEKIALYNMTAEAQKSDLAIWAGMANGIAGPGAAIATAYDLEKRNREAEENAEAVRESGRKLYSELKSIQANLPAALRAEEGMIQYIENRLFDDKNQHQKFKLLNISDIKYTINDGLNFDVEFKYDLRDELKLINSIATLDGSLKICVYDSENKLVASGYYNAEGMEKFDLKYKGLGNFDLNAVGFKGIRTRSCKCISSDYKEIDKDGEYKVVIEPNYLWLIEV